MNLLGRIGQQLDAGWFSRILVAIQIWFAWDLLLWSKAFASTALANGADLTGAAANVAAVAAAPLGLVTLAVNKYMEMRGPKSYVITGRRKEDKDEGRDPGGAG